jgi:hypothetical protein
VQKEVRIGRKKFSLSTMPTEIKWVLHAGLPCYPFSSSTSAEFGTCTVMGLNGTFVEITL